jgi:hypothetical protein
MAAENLADVINSLTPDEQESVKAVRRVPEAQGAVRVITVSRAGRRIYRSTPGTAPPSGPVTFYPTVDGVIAVHARLIAGFGGPLGIRDRGALESALGRPQSRYYTDIIKEAAFTKPAGWFEELEILLRQHAVPCDPPA